MRAQTAVRTIRTCDLCWHCQHECAAGQHSSTARHVQADCVNGPRHTAACDTWHGLDRHVCAALCFMECLDVGICHVKGFGHILRQLGPGQVLR
jgi:hypothetical protein